MSGAGEGRIVLASASPRRRELLAAAGVDFDVEPTGTLETFEPGEAPESAARRLAEEKARAVLGRRRGERTWILAADTVVAVPAEEGFRLLGKPADEVEAREMLRGISGTRHLVATGVAVARAEDGDVRSASEGTWVSMRAIASAEVERYVASGEWRDKAGGYAIQETADAFVTRLEGGGHDNVVGLPVRLALALLAAAGAQVPAAGPG